MKKVAIIPSEVLNCHLVHLSSNLEIFLCPHGSSLCLIIILIIHIANLDNAQWQIWQVLTTNIIMLNDNFNNSYLQFVQSLHRICTIPNENSYLHFLKFFMTLLTPLNENAYQQWHLLKDHHPYKSWKANVQNTIRNVKFSYITRHLKIVWFNA